LESPSRKKGLASRLKKQREVVLTRQRRQFLGRERENISKKDGKEGTTAAAIRMGGRLIEKKKDSPFFDGKLIYGNQKGIL